MITHAFFKALLFLGAGSVIHGMHDEQDMRHMGGLRKFMPITAGTFIVGWLAIAGIVPFAGFWSKDEILAKAWFDHSYALWAVGAVAALLTAFYMTRQVWLVFYGPERWRDDAALLDGRRPRTRRGRAAHAAAAAHGHDDAYEPHESPWTMYVPLSCSRFSRSSAGSSICRSPTRSSTCSIAGSSFPSAAAPSSFSAALVLSTDRARARCRSASSSASRVYRNGLRADGTDPTVVRLGGFAGVLAERVVPRRRARPLRQRSGHRVRPLPQ